MSKEVEMDRIVKQVVAPPLIPLPREKVFLPNGKPDLQTLHTHLNKEGRLDHAAALELVRMGGECFRKEPNLLKLKYPITVCGDVHGQFFDLMRLMEVGGDPKDTQYLFLGDYVDRGCFSSECVFYLYALKLTYPDTVFMLRGNHECRQLTSFFNFKDECFYKYSEEMYNAIMDSFDNLPIAAILQDAPDKKDASSIFFCVHGGLSPNICKIDEIGAIDRFQEIPREGLMCDLLWSDPYDEESEAAQDSDEPVDWFNYNETRQCSFVFGEEAVKKFQNDNGISSIIRAHEAQNDGYKMHMPNPADGVPRVITVFSAPNYCDVYQNKAACLKFAAGTLNIKQFVESPHPYYLPNFMDVFQWSIPFVAEKVTDMLDKVLNFGGEDDSEEDEAPAASEEKTGEAGPVTAHVPGAATAKLKRKVMAISKLLTFYKTLRENSEAIVQLKQLTANNKVPLGLLSQGAGAIDRAISSFEQAKRADQDNERRPSEGDAEQRQSVTLSNLSLGPKK